MKEERCILLTTWWEKLAPLRRKFISETYIGGFEKSDIEQECFLLLHKALQRYDPQIGVPFECYYKVVLNGCRANETRKKVNTEVAYEEESFFFLIDEEVNIERDVERKMIEEEITRLIALLDEKEKEVIEAYYFQNKTIKEIADLEGSTYKAVECRKRRALLKMSRTLL